MKLEYKLISNVEVMPSSKGCDAYIMSFDYDGREPTEAEFESLENDFEFYDEVLRSGK